MSARDHRGRCAGSVAGAVALAALALGLAAPRQSALSFGPLPESLRTRCLPCHEADLIVQQRLSRAAWIREVDKMIRWGAEVPDAEKDPMVDYLAAHFAPVRPGSVAAETAAAPAARGEETFRAKCLLCHESDLTEQQRLGRRGWEREVDKMVRWGAVVAPDEKGPLVDFLLSRYGPRPR